MKVVVFMFAVYVWHLATVSGVCWLLDLPFSLRIVNVAVVAFWHLVIATAILTELGLFVRDSHAQTLHVERMKEIVQQKEEARGNQVR